MKDMSPGTGKMYVKADGKIFYFCSGKCEKAMIGRKKNPRTTRWSGKFHEIKKEEQSKIKK